MTATRLLAVGLALLSGTAAVNAQTVISREVSNEPVETLITRGPDGITVTRRPLQTMAAPVVSTTPVFPTYGPSGELYTQSWVPAPAWTPGYAASPGYAVVAPAAPGYGSIDVRPYAPPPATTRTVVVDEDEVIEPTRPAVRTARRGTPPIMARAVEPEPRSTRTVTRRVTTEPMALAPTERTVLYRTLGQQQSYDPTTLEVVTPTYARPYGTTVYAPGYAPGYGGYAAAPAVRAVTYTVGSIIPETVTLAPVPRQVLVRVPSARGYGYAVVNDRVLLVEPTTGTVVADITR
ncbi:MAG: DUF1236 domain-containing protein [Rhodoplanes sp.]|uniref:DUF1236 domain-containing protein n=1 Tax=Rhodoplanes sp. TaxID=1968906 RepID=UPI001857DD35|nr:DUF1236 domain-containing protein [Rhodoplanes sp.]NVO17267.1 DUF1236 domain-containing protein [Rhodoplanes sp.]